VFIETKTATFRADDIQAAYNDALLSGRMSLAREIEQLWIGALVSQRALRASKPPSSGATLSDIRRRASTLLAVVEMNAHGTGLNRS
jgi:hypothetical protein